MKKKIQAYNFIKPSQYVQWDDIKVATRSMEMFVFLILLVELDDR